jgi:hypothetical protein
MKMTGPDLEHLKFVTRRKFFQQCGTGMGALALASLLNENFSLPPGKKPLCRRAARTSNRGKTSSTSSSPRPSHLTCLTTERELIKRNGQRCRTKC